MRIGCCGFRSSRAAYYGRLAAVEVQHTFYQPPRAATLEKWRAEAPAGFEFAVKAWQLVTHQASSPTYRRLKRSLGEEEKAGAGFFRPTAVVEEAWAVTLEAAEALAARAVLFQCPASFGPTEENVGRLHDFFEGRERRGLDFCWEPRGGWPDGLVRELCARLDLWHVVDPFAARTTTPARCYFRLHGRRGWRYSYEDGEMEELLSMLPRDAASYVFFNNVDMLANAVRFRELAAEAGRL